MAKKISKARNKALNDLQKEWNKAKGKMYRARAKGVELDFPIEANLRSVKKNHTQTLKSYTKQLEDFNRRTNLDTNLVKINDDVWITKSLLNDLNKVELELRVMKRREDDKQKKQPVKVSGEQVSTVYEQNRMRKPDTAFSRYLPDYNLKNAKRMADVQRAVQTRQRRTQQGWYDKKANIMRENFIHSLEERFNSLASDVIKEIENMNPYEFVNFYDGYVEIDFKFIPSGQPALTDDDFSVLYDILEAIRDLKDVSDESDNTSDSMIH